MSKNDDTFMLACVLTNNPVVIFTTLQNRIDRYVINPIEDAAVAINVY